MEASVPSKAWINAEALQNLLGAMSSAGEEEPCGVLLGRVEKDAVRIGEVAPAPNVHPAPERAFRIAPQDILRIAKGGREAGRTVVGFWHGHLTGPPTLGPADLEGLGAAEALGPSARILVVMGQGAGRVPVVRAYVRGRLGTQEIPLAV